MATPDPSPLIDTVTSPPPGVPEWIWYLLVGGAGGAGGLFTVFKRLASLPTEIEKLKADLEAIRRQLDPIVQEREDRKRAAKTAERIAAYLDEHGIVDLNPDQLAHIEKLSQTPAELEAQPGS